MQKTIKSAAVLGSGNMGSAIAAHFTNVGIPCLLLDLPATDCENLNAITIKGFQAIQKSKPAAFYSKKCMGHITVGNFQEDLSKIAECDLVIEAVIEKMDIKKEVLKKIDTFRRPSTIIATNTSGLSVNEMIGDCSDDMKKHFLGMHFFNPPRYLKLLEIIPTTYTRKQVVDFMSDFGENVLGKGIVTGKDTPNFIANRIGSYAMTKSMHIMIDRSYSIQEIDAFTGTNIGHPKSATFRTADIVGIDIVTHVCENLYRDLKDDDEIDQFQIPEFVTKLVQTGSLGVKTGKGFYRKTKENEIQVLDYTTGTYVSKKKLQFPSITAAKKEESSEGKLRTMVGAKDRASVFLWELFTSTFLYCVKRLGEIADTIVDMDNAMKWGWGYELGPFEKIDILGVASCVGKLKIQGVPIPQCIEDFIAQGNTSFYKSEKGVEYFYDFRSQSYKEIQRSPTILLLKNIKERTPVILSNASASLIDIGDGVACLEYHSKMNALGPDILSLTKQSLEEVNKNFVAMVINNQHATAFSAGANLMLLLLHCMEEEWDEIDFTIRAFQNMTMGLRYSQKPVVAATHGLTLAGGCEVAMHAALVVAHAETYMGMVEVGAGLIPAGGGTKEMLMRTMEDVPDSAIELPFLQKIFETIAMAKVSTSALEAKELGVLRTFDRIIVNRDHQLYYAKKAALGLALSGYRQPCLCKHIPVMGVQGYALVQAMVNNMAEGGFISDHDTCIALKIGRVITGGKITGKQKVSEQYVLDLEREAFLSLCGMRKTQERMKHIMETGKPLRN